MDTLPIWVQILGLVFGSGILGILGNLLVHWVGLLANTRTNFQSNLMERVHRLEGKLQHLQEEQEELHARAVRAEADKRLLVGSLRQMWSDLNELRVQQDLERKPFETYLPQEMYNEIFDVSSSVS